MWGRSFWNDEVGPEQARLVGRNDPENSGQCAVQQKVRLALCASWHQTDRMCCRAGQEGSQCPTTATNQRVLG